MALRPVYIGTGKTLYFPGDNRKKGRVRCAACRVTVTVSPTPCLSYNHKCSVHRFPSIDKLQEWICRLTGTVVRLCPVCGKTKMVTHVEYTHPLFTEPDTGATCRMGKPFPCTVTTCAACTISGHSVTCVKCGRIRTVWGNDACRTDTCDDCAAPPAPTPRLPTPPPVLFSLYTHLQCNVCGAYAKTTPTDHSIPFITTATVDACDACRRVCMECGRCVVGVCTRHMQPDPQQFGSTMTLHP